MSRGAFAVTRAEPDLVRLELYDDDHQPHTFVYLNDAAIPVLVRALLRVIEPIKETEGQ